MASNGVDLTQKKCVPCESGMPPLARQEAQALMGQLTGWTLSGDARWLSKEFKCKDFAEAMAFANKIAALAEEEGHHPDLCVAWGRVTVELSTHAIGGLSENDFILAAKINKIG